jgi:hypothetical protein
MENVKSQSFFRRKDGSSRAEGGMLGQIDREI